jgi:hypothetical protein
MNTDRPVSDPQHHGADTSKAARLQFEREVYCKLREAEKEAETKKSGFPLKKCPRR